MLVLDEPLSLFSLRNFRCDETFAMSASAQFSERTFRAVLPTFPLKGNLIVVDLRQESHGFIEGIPISWYFEGNKSNEGMTIEALEAKEQNQLKALALHDEVRVYSILEKREGVITRVQSDLSYLLETKKIETEKELMFRLQFSYCRLPVLDHHRPQETIVHQFVSFVKTLPEKSWLHFHCRGGKGRSTTFMVLYAILKNNKKYTLEEIVARQVRLGGSDLLSIAREKEKEWKKKAAIDRKQFIESFYDRYHNE